jgi:hypothetical protein
MPSKKSKSIKSKKLIRKNKKTIRKSIKKVRKNMKGGVPRINVHVHLFDVQAEFLDNDVRNNLFLNLNPFSDITVSNLINQIIIEVMGAIFDSPFPPEYQDSINRIIAIGQEPDRDYTQDFTLYVIENENENINVNPINDFNMRLEDLGIGDLNDKNIIFTLNDIDQIRAYSLQEMYFSR